MTLRSRLITGLDIGSSSIHLAVAQVLPSNHLKIVALAEVPSEGISRGIVTSIDDAVSSISACLEKAERMSGSTPEQVWVGINGPHLLTQGSRGVVAVAKPNGEIGSDDVRRVVEAAQAVATPPNYEILHVLPRSFAVDGQAGIKDPIGMTGVRLEVEAQVIEVQSVQIKNLTKCVYRTGVEIEDIVLAVLANAEVVLSKRQKELGVVLVNIGASTTSVLVYEEGDPLHVAVIKVGSASITKDIALCLRTSVDVAERLKVDYGHAVPTEVGKREEVELGDFSSEDGVVSRHHVSEVIEARVEELFQLVDAELKKIERSGKLAAGVVLTGGGAKLPGLTEVAKRILRLPATLGCPLDVASPLEKVNDLGFTTALGLVRWGANQISSTPGLRVPFPSWREVRHRIGKWLGNLLP